MDSNSQRSEVVLHCGVQGCCPTVLIKDDKVELKDDFGNVAKMTKKQWIMLAHQTVENL
jgi:hypothetical protein